MGWERDPARPVARTASQAQRAAWAEAGSVTAEFAFGFVALAAVLVMSLSSFALASAHLRVTDAARVAARLCATGATPAQAQVAAQRAAPGSTAQVVEQGEWVMVTVSAPALAPARWIGAEVSATSWAMREEALRQQWWLP
ncbi:MAG: TadE family type IV pilus minor pilin [Buchananella hordeovulneris]|nr:TadE family type IV pilus minor pilin [Buchananella hordeovulneris]